MDFQTAANTCLTQKYATFQGRAPRSEFWWFFPVGVMIPTVGAAAALTLGVSLPVALCIAGFLALPLFAAGARRLQDTGMAGHHAVIPWAFFAIAVFLANVALTNLNNLRAAFAAPVPPDGPGGFGFVIVYGYGSGLLLFFALLALLKFLFLITPAVGQTLVSSISGPNKYGPNPHEVTQ